MPRNLLSRYIWLVDTIRRHHAITRQQLNELWAKSTLGNGEPLPRRTFYNYRNAIEELFGIRIEWDPATYEYYIASDSDENGNTLTDWVLNSAAMSNVLIDMQAVSDRVFLEEVPSAQRYLSLVVNALRENKEVRFSYHPYTRSLPTPGVRVRPYFLKIFRQRWYMTGLNVSDGKVKTYALDRMGEVTVSTEQFAPPLHFNAAEFVRDSFGIVFSHGPVERIVLKVNSRRAKYLRALPLHHSQDEAIHDDFSIFTYHLRVTPDLVQEILSYGPEIVVLEPAPLRAMIKESLKHSLDNYEQL